MRAFPILLCIGGISDYTTEGTWCFYIHLPENIFINGSDFKRFNRKCKIEQLSSDSYYENYDYSNVPDYGFHGGITWYSVERFICRETGKKLKSLKIGCDYNHSWDRDIGYPFKLNSVEKDVKRMIEKLVSVHPVKVRCNWSGKIDAPEMFYRAKNGRLIHNSQLEKFRNDKDDMSNWLPMENIA